MDAVAFIAAPSLHHAVPERGAWREQSAGPARGSGVAGEASALSHAADVLRTAAGAAVAAAAAFGTVTGRRPVLRRRRPAFGLTLPGGRAVACSSVAAAATSVAPQAPPEEQADRPSSWPSKARGSTFQPADQLASAASGTARFGGATYGAQARDPAAEDPEVLEVEADPEPEVDRSETATDEDEDGDGVRWAEDDGLDEEAQMSLKEGEEEDESDGWEGLEEELSDEEDSDADEDMDAPDMNALGQSMKLSTTSKAISFAMRREIVLDKGLPEDLARLRWWKLDATYRFEGAEIEKAELKDGAGVPINRSELSGLEGTSPQRRMEAGREAFKTLVEVEKTAKPKTPFDAFQLATVQDKEIFAKASAANSQLKAIERIKADREAVRLADDVGTGDAAGNAYVEIVPRPGPEFDGPSREAANLVVSRALGVSIPKADKLIKLGAVWIYDAYYIKGWERIMKDERVPADTYLRVFPNPERHRMCYVEDWEDRIKSVDRDFVVVDKPPMLPCFAKVSNGRETLSMCVKEALNIRAWGGTSNEITDEMSPCHEVDEEVSGLIVLSRHETAVEYFDQQLRERKVVFEFVALCQGTVAKGKYRHFYNKNEKKPGQSKPMLYEEIPPKLIQGRYSYADWDIVEMEVVATAPLPGGAEAVRIRTYGTGWKERIRAQLAMLGAPVLNDDVIDVRGTQYPTDVALNARLIAPSKVSAQPKGEEEEGEKPRSLARAARMPLAGAVDEQTLRSTYGRKLQLLPLAQEAGARGVPQSPRKKVPVALHLARLEFGGRVITCAPPAYWPEGAAAAVAVKLTPQDIKTNVQAFLITQGGHCRFGHVGGRFGVRVEWLEEHFLVDRQYGVVFASAEAKYSWDAEMRVKTAKKAWGLAPPQRREKNKQMKMRLKETYVPASEWGSTKVPRFKAIKKGKVKPVGN